MKPIDILVDSDGTTFTHDFPEIGKDIGAAPVLRDLVAAGHLLIIFTMRSDRPKPSDQRLYLQEAVGWYHKNGIPLHGIQVNPTQHYWTTSPKAFGQLILDDICLGIPLITWVQDPDSDHLFPATTHDPALILSNLPYHERPYVDWGNTRKLLTDRGILK